MKMVYSLRKVHGNKLVGLVIRTIKQKKPFDGEKF
jgi:hypothetical protein